MPRQDKILAHYEKPIRVTGPQKATAKYVPSGVISNESGARSLVRGQKGIIMHRPRKGKPRLVPNVPSDHSATGDRTWCDRMFRYQILPMTFLDTVHDVHMGFRLMSWRPRENLYASFRPGRCPDSFEFVAGTNPKLSHSQSSITTRA